MKCFQQILRDHNSSERGIRYRRLKLSEVDALRQKAAQIARASGASPEDIPSLRRQTFVREGAKAMLIAVTKERVPLPELPKKIPGPALADGTPGPDVQPPAVEPELKDESLWQDVSLQMLAQPGPFTYEFDEATGTGLFTPPDDAYLQSIFVLNHEPNLASAEQVLGKERTVSRG